MPPPGHSGQAWSVIRPDVKADDVVQGVISDCWILAPLASVVERALPLLLDGALRDCSYKPVSGNLGIFHVRLFLDGEWKTFELINKFPFRGKQRLGAAFKRHQLFPALVEKAFLQAENHQSVESLQYGCSFRALVALVGPVASGSYNIYHAAPEFKHTFLSLDPGTSKDLLVCISFANRVGSRMRPHHVSS